MSVGEKVVAAPVAETRVVAVRAVVDRVPVMAEALRAAAARAGENMVVAGNGEEKTVDAPEVAETAAVERVVAVMAAVMRVVAKMAVAKVAAGVAAAATVEEVTAVVAMAVAAMVAALVMVAVV